MLLLLSANFFSTDILQKQPDQGLPCVCLSLLGKQISVRNFRMFTVSNQTESNLDSMWLKPERGKSYAHQCETTGSSSGSLQLHPF